MEEYIWPEGDDFQHSEHAEHAFCYDLTCPCHDNQDSINNLHQAHQDGLVTDRERDNIYRGKGV